VDIQDESQAMLDSVMRWEFQRCFHQRDRRLALFMKSEGTYFKEDNFEL